MDSRLLLVWLHLLIGAVWYGGLMTALVGVRAAGSVQAPAAGAALLRRFQRIAWLALAGMAATGIPGAMLVIPVLQAGGSISSFMWTLALKIALFGAVVTVTFVQHWVYGRALVGGGDSKALAGYTRLARVNLLLGAVILLFGLGLERGGLF